MPPTSTKRVAITGGTGFLGRALVAELVAAGYQCVVLSRNPKRAQETFSSEITVCGYDQLPDKPDQIDAIFHIAGETPAGVWTHAKMRAIYDSRVQSTRQIVTWIKHLRKAAAAPHTLLCASAVGIYGHRPGEILTETSSYDTDDGFRARVCLDWEAAAKEAEDAGVRVVRLRLSHILHPDGGYLAIMQQLYRFGLRFVWGSNHDRISWISRTDAARMLRFALEQEQIAGPLHVAAPTPTTQREFAEEVLRLRSHRVWARIPRWLVKLVLGELSHAILDSQDIRPALAQAHGFAFEHPDFPAFIRRFQGETS